MNLSDRTMTGRGMFYENDRLFGFVVEGPDLESGQVAELRVLD